MKEDRRRRGWEGRRRRMGGCRKIGRGGRGGKGGRGRGGEGGGGCNGKNGRRRRRGCNR